MLFGHNVQLALSMIMTVTTTFGVSLTLLYSSLMQASDLWCASHPLFLLTTSIPPLLLSRVAIAIHATIKSHRLRDDGAGQYHDASLERC